VYNFVHKRSKFFSTTSLCCVTSPTEVTRGNFLVGMHLGAGSPVGRYGAGSGPNATVKLRLWVTDPSCPFDDLSCPMQKHALNKHTHLLVSDFSA
jgi:hypothetical protein